MCWPGCSTSPISSSPSASTAACSTAPRSTRRAWPALLSTFVYEHRSPEPAPPPWFPSADVKARWRRILATSEDLAADERATGLAEHRPPDPGFAAAAYAWVAGEGLADVVAGEEVAGGDFVRTMKQLVDLARQLALVAPDPATRERAREVERAGVPRGRRRRRRRRRRVVERVGVTIMAFPGHAGRRWPLARWRSLARIVHWRTDDDPARAGVGRGRTGAAEPAVGRHRRRTGAAGRPGRTAPAPCGRRRPAPDARWSVVGARPPTSADRRAPPHRRRPPVRRHRPRRSPPRRDVGVVARTDHRGDERRPDRSLGGRPSFPPERRSRRDRRGRRAARRCGRAGRRGGACRRARTCRIRRSTPAGWP